MDGEKRLGGIGDYIAQELMKKTDVECRVTSLGHVQREPHQLLVIEF